MSIGANILRIREKKSLSRAELGAKIGVSEAQIGNYERGENEPRPDKLLKLADALGVTELELRGLNSELNHTSVPKFDYRKGRFRG